MAEVVSIMRGTIEAHKRIKRGLRAALWPFVKYCKVESMKGPPPDDATPILEAHAGSVKATVTGADIHAAVGVYEGGTDD